MKVTLEYREPYIHDRLNKYLLGFALSGISTGYYIIREKSEENLDYYDQIGIRSYLDENNYYEKNEAYIQYYKDINDITSKKDPVLLHIEMSDVEYRNKGTSDFTFYPPTQDYFISNVYLGVYYEPTGITKAKIFIEGLTIGNFSFLKNGCINLYNNSNNEFINYENLAIKKNTIKDSDEDNELTITGETTIVTPCMRPIHIAQPDGAGGWGKNTDYVIRFALDLAKTKLEAKYNYIIDSDGNKYQLILIDQLIIRGLFNDIKIIDYELDNENWKSDLSLLPSSSITIMHSMGRTNLEEMFLNLENQILVSTSLNQEATSLKALNLYNFRISDLSNQIYSGNTFWSSSDSSGDYCSLWFYCKCLKPGHACIVNNNWQFSAQEFSLKTISAPIITEIIDNKIIWSYPTLKIAYTLIYKNPNPETETKIYSIPYIYPVLRNKQMNNFSEELLGPFTLENIRNFCNHNLKISNNDYSLITGYVLINISEFYDKIRFFEKYDNFNFSEINLINSMLYLDEQTFEIDVRLAVDSSSDSFKFNRVSLVSLSVDLLNKLRIDNKKYFKSFNFD